MPEERCLPVLLRETDVALVLMRKNGTLNEGKLMTSGIRLCDNLGMPNCLRAQHGNTLLHIAQRHVSCNSNVYVYTTRVLRWVRTHAEDCGALLASCWNVMNGCHVLQVLRLLP